MKEGIIDIKLMNRLAAGEHQREDSPYCGWLDDRTESLGEVNVGALCEAAQHPACLVALERTIRLVLVLENPLASHNVRSRWSRNEIPRAVGQESVELLLHSTSPIRKARRGDSPPSRRLGEDGARRGDAIHMP